MTRQYDAMLKPRRFNIGDLVLKKGFFGNKKPGSWEIGTQLGKDPTRLSIAKGKDPTTWKPWMGGNWSIFRMFNT